MDIKGSTERQEAEREKIRNTLAILRGHTRPPKGKERSCFWDQAESRLRFKAGGARELKDFGAAKKYAERNGYTLEEK